MNWLTKLGFLSLHAVGFGFFMCSIFGMAAIQYKHRALEMVATLLLNLGFYGIPFLLGLSLLFLLIGKPILFKCACFLSLGIGGTSLVYALILALLFMPSK